MSNFYKDSKTVATGWATITSAGKSTVVSDSMKTANGTSKSDTIKVAPIDHATRRIYSNGGNDFIDISGNYGILWSKATVKTGTGNDSIRIYADVDGIHPATVNIDSGVGNDFVSIYGGNNGFHGGTIGLTTDEKTSVSLNLGDGNDKLFIHGLREKGIDISKVKIAGGKGNDLISIYGGSSGIGGWADYGNATVSIDGGVGADTIAVNSIDNYGDVTITAGTGDVISVGSGTADYFFDSTKKVTINGAVFTAKSKNTSAKITTDSNSITLNSDWNGTIKLQQGQKLTDAVGNVISKAGTYSIVKGKSSVESGKAGIETIKGSNIYNYYGNRFVDCTDFNDSIINYQASNVTICAKNGNDYVNNYEGKDISINSGAGNDSVENSGTRATIESGSGNDSISNGSSKVTIIAGAGNDIIANGGASVTIDAGSGNDSISNRSSKVIINAGSGNDDIINDSSKVTIIAGTGNDSIENRNSEVYINGDEGSDHIDNWFHGDNLTINSGMGDDSIYNSCSYVTINAEDGNDYIKSSRGENVSINGGVGNDSIANSSTNVTIDAGNGNNYIYNDGNDVSMSSGNGDDSIENLDTDVVIDTGDGNDTITNDSSKVTIHASSGNDYIKNLHKKNSSSTDVVINTGNGDDSIENNSAQVTIDAGNGNDYILCDFGKNATINGGNGNDSIYMDCTTDYEINGGADSDYIYANGGGFCTINGGLGNDSICIDFGGTFAINGNSGNDVVTLSSEVTNVTINYASGEGKDTLYGFNSDDKIKITSGNISDAKLKGNDVVVTVDKGTITLKDSKDKEITVIDPKGKKIKFTNTYKTKDATDGGGESVGGTGSYKNDTDNVILYGTPKNDKNLSNVGNKVQIYGLAGNDTINNYEMIGGKSTIGDDVTIVGGKGNDLISGTNSTTHIKYEWGDGNDTIWSFNGTKGGGIIELGKNAYFKGASLNGNDVIVNVSDGSIVFREGKNNPFSVVDAKGTTFNVKGSCQLNPYPNTTNVKNSKITVKYHKGYYGESITGANGSATLEVGDSFIKDNSGNISKVYVFGSNSANIKADGTPITIYGTDSNGSEYSKIADVINGSVNLHKDNSGRTIIEAVNKKNSITVNVVADNVDIIGSNKKDIITSSGKKSYIDSGSGNDNVISDGKNSTVVGGNDNDTIKYDYSSGFLKLSDATVKKAVYKDKDRNEIITTTVDKNITLRNISKTQNITIYGNYGRIDFSGNYGGDPSYYQAEAEGLLKKAKSDIAKKLQSDLESLPTPPNISSDLSTDVKESLKLVSGNVDDVPTKAYEKIATHIIEALNNSTPEELTVMSSSWISNVIKMISKLGNTSDTFQEHGKNYKIEYNKLIAGGSGTALITVKNGRNTIAQFNWNDSKKHINKILNKYASSLKELSEDVWYNVVTSTLKDLTGKITHPEKYAIYAQNIVAAVTEGDISKLGSELTQAFRYFCRNDALTISYLNTSVSKLKHGKKLQAALNAFKKLDELRIKFKHLENVSKLGNSYAELQKSYNTVESILNGISSSKMIASNISYFSADNDFAGCEKISKSVSDLWFSDEGTNFSNSSAHIDSITKSDLSDYLLGNVDTPTDWTTLSPKDSLTSSLTFSKK